MRKFLITLALVSIAAPDPMLTPGKVNPNLTKEVICGKGFSTENYRTVTESKKKQVFRLYKIDYSNHRSYEVDHLISLELGGSNDVQNLWPQPYPQAHWKDRIENFLHRAVCREGMDLAAAQKQVIAEWYPIYRNQLELDSERGKF